MYKLCYVPAGDYDEMQSSLYQYFVPMGLGLLKKSFVNLRVTLRVPSW
jgi:hypothetical protein